MHPQVPLLERGGSAGRLLSHSPSNDACRLRPRPKAICKKSIGLTPPRRALGEQVAALMTVCTSRIADTMVSSATP
jgi:hypothetical protein